MITVMHIPRLLLLASCVILLQSVRPALVEAVPVAHWDRITNPPPARMAAGMTYDSRRHRVLVFGGCKNFGSISDLWSLDLSSSEWTEVAPWWEGPQYESCYGRDAVYDSLRDEVLILKPGVYYGGLGDTVAIYARSFSSTPGWRVLETSGTGPPKPGNHIMVLDPGEHRIILISDQIWALSLDLPLTWTRLFPTGSAPSLNGVAAALDAKRRRVLVNGGGSFGAPFVAATWALDLTGSTHWDVLPVSPLPTPRRDHVAIYDPLRNRFVVAGGYSGSELLDAWALDLAAGTWSEVAPSDPHFVKRYAPSAVYDPRGDAMVIFGGVDWSNYLVETARLSFASPGWAIDPPTAEPVHNATMVYDDQRRRMLLFGGVGSAENARDRLYSLDMTLQPPRWQQILVSGTKPVRRYSHMATWDPVRHRMFVFGGHVDATYLNDLWFYSDEAGPQWTQVTTTGPTPSARASGALVYDPGRDRLLLMGGRSDLLDVWELPLSGSAALQWRTLAPSGTTPSPRLAMGLLYDTIRDRMVVVAGTDGGGNSQATYALDFGVGGDGMWTTVASRLNGLYSAAAIMREDSIVVYDQYSATSPQETKQLALTAPTAWKTVEVAGPTPPRRLDHSGAYDVHQDRLVVFGGQIMPYSNTERRWFGDTWLLSWFNELVGVGPSGPAERSVLGTPKPNPARDQITVALSRPRPGPASLEILDINGRRVLARQLDEAFTSGTVAIDLDRGVKAGVYFLRLVGPQLNETRRFCLLR